jgi:hypothetical protein
MGRLRILIAALALVTAMAVIVPAAQGKKDRKITVHLTIEVNSSGHTIHGGVISGAKFEICESAKVKIRQSLPGADKTIAKVKPKDKEWRFAVPASLRGESVYVETSNYAVPAKNVRCLGARSKTVTAL